jgi:tetratricopeptide (TPR) repeat protein
VVRHQSFFDNLAALDNDSVEWKVGLAGLGTLRLLDAAVDGPRLAQTDRTAVRVVRDSIAAVPEGDPIRGILSRVLDELENNHPSWNTIAATLVNYGRALDFDGRWALATSVFEIASQIATANGDWSIAIEANIALGGSARRAGQWKKSHAGYAEALYLAGGLGDTPSSLTVRIGMANTQLAHGNLPAADRILSDVVDEASSNGFEEIVADALHSRSSVAHRRGAVAESLTIAYEAFRKSSNPTRQDTILADIGAYFGELGMREAARDAHMIVAATSQLQWVRWQATLNLMELAYLDGAESVFDRYAVELSIAELPSQLRAYALLYTGMGCLRFGREQEGREKLAEADRYASVKGIHQVALEAEKALTHAHEFLGAPSTAADDAPELEEATTIAKSLSDLREIMLSSPQPV